ncbi:hypothetical protein D6825_03930, partial [Candidatus Woesearchaeota archaeon]
WLFLFALFKIIDTILSLRAVIIKRLVPNALLITDWVMLTALAALIFTAFASYPKLNTKEIFELNRTTAILFAIFSASIYLATQFIINQVSKASLDAGLLAGILLLFPAITLIKTYTARVVYNA